MNYSKLFKEKQTNKHLKTKYWFRENCNFFCKKQSLPANFLHYVECCKWCCKECSLIFTSEEQAKEHFLGKKHQNIANNKIFFNINCWRRINHIHKMPHGKQSLLLNKKFNNGKSGNLRNYKNLEPKDTLCGVIPRKAGRDNILSTVIKSEKGSFSSSDLSIYRTPSGKYYCRSCDLSVNSQAQFFQHTESRKHKHKANKPAYKLK